MFYRGVHRAVSAIGSIGRMSRDTKSRLQHSHQYVFLLLQRINDRKHERHRGKTCTAFQQNQSGSTDHGLLLQPEYL